jgi:hypothetical protein
MMMCRQAVLVTAAVALLILAGCTGERGQTEGTADMPDAELADLAGKVLLVKWQRLVDESGQTCERCAMTEMEVHKALRLLGSSLEPLGIDVRLEEKKLSPAECASDISQSNRIWIGNVSIEQWLGAEVGASPCAGCCGDLSGCHESEGGTVECRTVVIGDRVYEEIPAELILKAGLLAAANLILPIEAASCCPSAECGGACDACPK